MLECREQVEAVYDEFDCDGLVVLDAWVLCEAYFCPDGSVCCDVLVEVTSFSDLRALCFLFEDEVRRLCRVREMCSDLCQKLLGGYAEVHVDCAFQLRR